MKTRTLKVPCKMSFDEIMDLHGYEGLIPTDKIINKRVPGIGATYNEIMSHRPSIIIVPFTAIIEVKRLRHGEDLFVVYGEYDPEAVIVDLLAYLNNDNIPYKKIMTTPESFYKVKAALLKHHPNYINDYFILIDECDVLVQDAIFRKNIIQIMPDFFVFKGKSMISATPLLPSDPRFENEGFEYLILEPIYHVKPKLNLIVTNNINATTRERIDFLNTKDDKPILIFTNCKRTIAYLADLEFIKGDYKIFCNETLSTDFFKPRGINNVFDSVTSQEYGKYNFFTSRFFSGVDFFLPEESSPHVIMISNVTQTPHSIISPLVTAVQIYGRSRNGVSSITHITNIHKDIQFEDKQDIIDLIDKRIYHLTELQKLKGKSYEKLTMKIIGDLADKDHANVMFNKDGTINHFFRDNYLFSTITRNLYCKEEALLQEYEEGNFFAPKLRSVYKPLMEEDLMKLTKLKNKKKSGEILIQLEELISQYGLYYIGNDHEQFYAHLNLLSKEDPLIYEAYFVLGANEIRRLKFKRKDLRNKIFDTKSGDKKNYMRMIDEILLTFPLQIPTYIDTIENELNAIYKTFNYQRKAGKLAKASGTDIEDYFEFKRVNGKKKIDGVYKTYYILYALKFKISEEAIRLR